jgi:hypothetical protein
MVTETDAKVMRWKMTIQEFDCDIEHIPGVDNIVADGLSRLLPMILHWTYRREHVKKFIRYCPVCQ